MKDEVKMQTTLASENLEKYQREVMLHGADVHAASTLRTEAASLARQVFFSILLMSPHFTPFKPAN